MAQGLDELIEWLVGEVAFYGDGESTLDRKPGFTGCKNPRKAAYDAGLDRWGSAVTRHHKPAWDGLTVLSRAHRNGAPLLRTSTNIHPRMCHFRPLRLGEEVWERRRVC